jgi:hypothetical protein
MSISSELSLSSPKVTVPIFKITKIQKFDEKSKKNGKRTTYYDYSKDWSRDDIVSMFIYEIFKLVGIDPFPYYRNLSLTFKKRSDIDKYFPQRKIIARKFLLKNKEVRKILFQHKNKQIAFLEEDIISLKKAVLEYLSTSKFLSKLRERRISQNLEMYQFKGPKNAQKNEEVIFDSGFRFKNISIQLKKEDYRCLMEMPQNFGKEIFLDGKLACEFLLSQAETQKS